MQLLWQGTHSAAGCNDDTHHSLEGGSMHVLSGLHIPPYRTRHAAADTSPHSEINNRTKVISSLGVGMMHCSMHVPSGPHRPGQGVGPTHVVLLINFSSQV
jgi:hypothetical protein